MHESVAPLSQIMELNTRLFLNCLCDLDDSVTQKRPNEETNNIAFVALHLLDARYYLCDQVGAPVSNQLKDELASYNSFEDISEFPPLESVRSAWQQAGETLSAGLGKLSETDIAKTISDSFPIEDHTLLGGIAFLLQHESYHIGQLAFMRKFFGYGATSYDESVPIKNGDEGT